MYVTVCDVKVKECSSWKAHHAADHKVQYWKQRRQQAKAAKNGGPASAAGGHSAAHHAAVVASQAIPANDDTVYFPPAFGGAHVVPGPRQAPDVKGVPLFECKLLVKGTLP